MGEPTPMDLDQEDMSEEDQEDVWEAEEAPWGTCSQCNEQAEFSIFTEAEYRDAKPDDNFSPCPACNQAIGATAANVRACMGCWVAWHENCFTLPT